MPGHSDTPPPQPTAREGGSALVMVIFIIVVLALLLAALAYINSASNRNTALQIASTRAYWAAQSGAEWGVYQIAPSTGNAASQCFSPNPTNPPLQIPGLNGCTVAVSCSSASPSSGITQFRIGSSGRCPTGNLGPGNTAITANRELIVGLSVLQNTSQSCQQCNSSISACTNYCTDYLGGGIFAYLICSYYCTFYQKAVCNIVACQGTPGSSTSTLSYWLESP